MYGRKQDRLSGNLQITGVAAGGKRYQKTFALRFNSDGGNEAIAQLWGRAKIKELMLEMINGETPEKVDAATNVALGYRLMSKYTAFVAVSDEPRVEANSPSRQEAVERETPDGMVPNNSGRQATGKQQSSGSSSNQATGKQQTSDGMASTPEPSLILAMLLFGLYMGWKQWVYWRKAKKLSENS